MSIYYQYLQNGARDMRLMNAPMNQDSVLGASTNYVNESILPEEARLEAMKQMGNPTDRIRGEHIETLRKTLSKGPDGHRHYTIQRSQSNAHAQSRNIGAVQSSHGAAALTKHTQQPHQQSQKKKGIEKQRTKKRLSKCILKGSPGTQVAAEEVLEDLIHNRPSTALDHILEKENESESETEAGNTPSQQVANDAIKIKKVERKRKGMD